MPVSYRDSIGFVGGGNMAEALLAGIIRSDIIEAEKILISEPRQERRDLLKLHYGAMIMDDNREVTQKAGTIIIAVKPQDMKDVLDIVRGTTSDGQLVVSIAAGVTIDFLEKHLESTPVIRAMPNTPALLEVGATVISPGKGADSEMLAWIRTIFDSVGLCLILPEEQMDAVTGLSGSGPAYIFTAAKALIEGGLRMGLSEKEARQLALQTIYGAAKMLSETNKSPEELIDMVASPGGTTVAGLKALDEGKFSETLIKAVEAATLRSAELGKK